MRHWLAGPVLAVCVVALCLVAGSRVAVAGDAAPAAGASSQAAQTRPGEAGSAGTGTAAMPVGRATTGKVRRGELLEVKIDGVTAGSKVSIHFENLRTAGWVSPTADSQVAMPGAVFTGSDLTFTPAAGSREAGAPREVTFVAGIIISGSMHGTAKIENGGAVTLKTRFGATTTRGGFFVLASIHLPDTCELTGKCLVHDPCDNRIGEDCYLFDNQFMCCLVCPTGC